MKMDRSGNNFSQVLWDLTGCYLRKIVIPGGARRNSSHNSHPFTLPRERSIRQMRVYDFWIINMNKS